MWKNPVRRLAFSSFLSPQSSSLLSRNQTLGPEVWESRLFEYTPPPLQKPFSVPKEGSSSSTSQNQEENCQINLCRNASWSLEIPGESDDLSLLKELQVPETWW
ncbi:hypothetical protein R6Z07F_008408 [Ovis aries]